MTGHPINLIRQCKCVLLEAHAVACISCQAPCVGFPGRLAHPLATLPRRSRHKRAVIRTNSAYSQSGRRELAETAAGHRLEQRFAGRALVVPGDRDVTEEVRVRRLETLVPLEHLGETHHATFTADAADLDRLGLNGH